jgi:hypothetical protein
MRKLPLLVLERGNEVMRGNGIDLELTALFWFLDIRVGVGSEIDAYIGVLYVF